MSKERPAVRKAGGQGVGTRGGGTLFSQWPSSSLLCLPAASLKIFSAITVGIQSVSLSSWKLLEDKDPV